MPQEHPWRGLLLVLLPPHETQLKAATLALFGPSAGWVLRQGGLQREGCPWPLPMCALAAVRLAFMPCGSVVVRLGPGWFEAGCIGGTSYKQSFSWRLRPFTRGFHYRLC